ncbi:putative CTD nuclear envelope phosphatase 1A-like [Trypanosoma rangeli]|uniref:Putative CTD nuclear envelope phosphatase 1A-like n=1 Tax=Trypanosoma rangeli TaxID=5698 RepID=A0A422N174_TRYRA|nr:putative CTD nuclear envelope phosphatase 1A-like [Trypanosoma rangeli]RNE99212.1 putative CTD nuclear envelope phosphatase 1A-like [Trypanosoma rangeli]|eukprot:RNE99212.1 putative CTD nuclear envelope phosphatase 1A-like [Trypanosoma rangeli]
MGCMQRLLNVVLPCVFCLFQEALLDGVMACRNIHKTLYVLGCFFTGRSHLAYPCPLVQLKKKKPNLRCIGAANLIPPDLSLPLAAVQRLSCGNHLVTVYYHERMAGRGVIPPC